MANMVEKLSDITSQIREATDNTTVEELTKQWGDSFPGLLAELCNDDWKELQDLLCTCIDHGHERIITNFAIKVLERKDLIDWKRHPDVIDSICDTLVRSAFVVQDSYKKNFSTVIEKIFQIIRSKKLLKAKKGILYNMILAAVNAPDIDLPIHVIPKYLANDYPWKEEDPQSLVNLIKALSDSVQANPMLDMSNDKAISTKRLLSNILLESSVQRLRKISPTIEELFNFCKDQEWYTADSNHKTISHKCLQIILEDFLCRHDSETKLLKPYMETVNELWECGDEIMERDANNLMVSVASDIELVGDQLDTLMDHYFKQNETVLISKFQFLYPKAKDKFFERFDELIEAMADGDMWCRVCTLQILTSMARERPEAFTKRSFEAIIDKMEDAEVAHIACQALTPLAEKRPADIMQYDGKIMQAVKNLLPNGIAGAPILVALAGLSEEKAPVYMKCLINMAPDLDKNMQTAVLYYMRGIGQKWKHVLAEHTTLIEKLASDPITRESANACLDIINNRSLGKVAKEVFKTKQGVEELDDRVENTEELMDHLGQQIDRNTDNLQGVNLEADKQTDRIENIEDAVEETGELIEELQHKTLSHAPMWAGDAANILNPSAENDWRLVASRLGYTNDDIRNWATQANPCLSMFDEWFATHKTREATFGVLKQLQELNQIQAAMIVENALKAAEGVLIDEEEEYVEPPPIFISYQWGHQDEVKLLKQHLQMAGFQVWMDIGQMGGGDKLFLKIDEGIRASKIMICCVSEKYAKSPNCNREVNLAVNLGKPMIPLLMEKLNWPPPGSMGPIFGEYLFIRFFKRSSEDGEQYWASQKFQELLMQLLYHVVPKQELITKTYGNWMNTPEEMVQIKPKSEATTVSGAKSTNLTQKVQEENAEVFISYQWGKQSEIKLLFTKLKVEGFNCWLDIMQMGGGDSLYDKIDKGIRNCRVFLACSTTKYSLSANCRREVSLADALKKPIIPLLLENKMSWPPEGPMSMVLTQLKYIKFNDGVTDLCNNWDVPQFQDLINKITSYMSEGSRTSRESKNMNGNEVHPTGRNSEKPGTTNDISRKEEAAPSGKTSEHSSPKTGKTKKSLTCMVL